LNRPVILALSLCAFGIPLPAQSRTSQVGSVEPLEVTLAYSVDRSNAPPGVCGCFWMSGGRVEASAPFGRVLSVVADLGGEHASNINSAHESLSLVTYLFGPRLSLRSHSRFVPFGQFLVGGVHGFDALFPGSSEPPPDALAFATGAGLNFNLNSRFTVRLVQADYLQTQLPNDTGDRENSVRFSGGVVLRFFRTR